MTTLTLTYKLYLIEPVLVTAPGGDPNTDESLPFIPGSAIRGALACGYIRQHGKEAGTTPEFIRLFLNGKVRYLNAYFAGQNGDFRALPTPRSWVGEKDDPGQATDDDTGEKWLIYDRSQIDPPAAMTRFAPFMQWEAGTANAAMPDYEIAVHTARNREAGRAVENDPDSALYRYRALAAGQYFRGAIVLDDGAETEADIAELAKLLAGTTFIGGSHSAGYGLVKVVVDEGAKNSTWREVEGQTTPDIAKGNQVMFYLLSDAILRDSSGQPTGDLYTALPDDWQQRLKKIEQPNEAQDKSGSEDENFPQTVFTHMIWVSGFNRKWGLPLPQSYAVERGSVWIFEAAEDIPAKAIVELEQAGIGARRAEGFGRVAVNPPWQGNSLAWHKREQPPLLPQAQDGPPNVEAITARANDLLKEMQKRLALQELDRLVMQAAQQVTYSGNLSKSQLARLRLRVQQVEAQADWQPFLDYLEDTRKRKSADDQFRRFNIRLHDGSRKNFREWLEGLAGSPADIWKLILPSTDWKTPQLGEPYSFQSDDEQTLHYTVRLIDAVCEQLAKKGRADQ